MNKQKIAIVVLVIIALSVVGYVSYRNYKSGLPVAEVNGEKISTRDYDKRTSYELARIEVGKKITADEKKKILTETLDNMVQEMVIEQNAAKENLLSYKENEINLETQKKLDSWLSNNETKTNFEKNISSKGLTMEYVKEQLKKGMIIELIRDSISKDSVVSEKVAKGYYDSNKNKYIQGNPSINVSVICLKDEKEGTKAVEELNKGDKFETLVKKYSIDTATKDKDGNMGNIDYNDSKYDPTFIKVASELDVGKVSGVVNINGVNYIIKLNKKSPVKYKAFEDVKAEILKEPMLLAAIKAKAVEDVFKKWHENSKIQKFI